MPAEPGQDSRPPLLKDRSTSADIGVMRFQRLVLESGNVAFTLPLHHRLTVIGGVGRAEREGLVGELLGALAGSRRGVRLEVCTDTGRRLLVERAARPERDRVVEIESGADVTAEFRQTDGRVDLLRAGGLSADGARLLTRVTAFDLEAGADADATIARLADLDQDALWAAADELIATETRLREEAEAAGATAEDAPLIEAVEERHAAFEAAQARHESFRHHAIFIGGAAALGAVPAALLNRWTAIPFLAVALLTTLVSIRFRRRLHKARRAEQEALTAAGAESYLAFHVQRMNELLDSEQTRERIAAAATAHRRAAAQWRTMAGEVAPAWAIEARTRIEEAATDPNRRRAKRVAATDPAEIAESLIARMAELRHAAGEGESLPLVLDDPFDGMTTAVKRWLLDLVGRSAGSPQVVILTEDADVTEWARSEAQAGAKLVLIEPATAEAGAA